jgi:hypothetical protein
LSTTRGWRLDTCTVVRDVDVIVHSDIVIDIDINVIVIDIDCTMTP